MTHVSPPIRTRCSPEITRVRKAFLDAFRSANSCGVYKVGLPDSKSNIHIALVLGQVPFAVRLIQDSPLCWRKVNRVLQADRISLCLLTE